MKNKIYGIYDQAAECYVQFLPCQNEAVARMTFEKLYKDRRLNVPMLYDYPNLYDVRLLAVFDDNNGRFENVEMQDMLLNFGSLLVENKEAVSV